MLFSGKINIMDAIAPIVDILKENVADTGVVVSFVQSFLDAANEASHVVIALSSKVQPAETEALTPLVAPTTVVQEDIARVFSTLGVTEGVAAEDADARLAISFWSIGFSVSHPLISKRTPL